MVRATAAVDALAYRPTRTVFVTHRCISTVFRPRAPLFISHVRVLHIQTYIEEQIVERESMEYDVVIVGAGPSALAAASRIRQLNEDLSVCVLEKGSQVGAHIMSGAVLEPTALNELFPDWKDRGAPLLAPVAEDQIYYFTSATGAIKVPNFLAPKTMHNHGNYVVSLANVWRWGAEQA